MKPRHMILLRKSAQIIFLLLFIFLIFVSRAKYQPIQASNLFVRFDPLVTLTASVAGRVLVSGFGFSLLTLGLTILFGRVWCSWICPLGTIFDLIKPKNRNTQILTHSDRFRKGKYIAFIVIFFLAVFGQEIYTYLDPITILQRAFTLSVIPSLKSIIYQSEATLYAFEPLWGVLDWIHNNFVFPIFRDIDSLFRLATPTFLILVTIIALSWVTERFWCRYLCPLGGLLGLLSKFSFFKRVVTSDCTSCKQCAKICPTGTIDDKKNYLSDSAECTVCFECSEACKFTANQFKWSLSIKQSGGNFSYNPKRRDVLTSIGVAAGSLALATIDPTHKEDIPTLIRPPGASKKQFDILCIRCSQCINVCPTQGLQPSGFENGWANLFTPRLMPRTGFCDYNCTACTDICPTSAILSLALEEKQLKPIGLARIDQNRCLPWAYLTSCIICEEACPLPEKAVKFQEDQVLNHKGEQISIKRPFVVKDLCIGCGICEHKCPLTGEAAIRVFTLPKDVNLPYPSV